RSRSPPTRTSRRTSGVTSPKPPLSLGRSATRRSRSSTGASGARSRSDNERRLDGAHQRGEVPALPAPGAGVRVGIGADAHALVEGVPLVLGGVEVESERGLA